MPLSKYDIELNLEEQDGTSHAILAELVGANKRVLDVGCDAGYLGEALAAFGNRVWGFERNEEAARVARERLIDCKVGDLEQVHLTNVFEPGSFDIVIFGDVLEHLRDPLSVLRASRPLVAPGGSVLVSTPNVAHGDVRLALLRGQFRYTKLGILDETHTRFFTASSLRDFAHDAGFVLADLRRTRAELFSTEVGISEQDFDPALVAGLRDDPEATTYQFVARLVPDDATTLATEQALQVDELRNAIWVAERELDRQRADLAQLRAERDQLLDRVDQIQAAHDEAVRQRNEVLAAHQQASAAQTPHASLPRRMMRRLRAATGNR